MRVRVYDQPPQNYVMQREEIPLKSNEYDNRTTTNLEKAKTKNNQQSEQQSDQM